MPPEVQDILLHALLNPATLLAGYWLGRKADQVQKVVIAAFIAALIGTVYTGVRMWFGLAEPKPKLLAGILVASLLVGLVWSWIGFWTRSLRGGPDKPV